MWAMSDRLVAALTGGGTVVTELESGWLLLAKPLTVASSPLPPTRRVLAPVVGALAGPALTLTVGSYVGVGGIEGVAVRALILPGILCCQSIAAQHVGPHRDRFQVRRVRAVIKAAASGFHVVDGVTRRDGTDEERIGEPMHQHQSSSYSKLRMSSVAFRVARPPARAIQVQVLQPPLPRWWSCLIRHGAFYRGMALSVTVG